LIANMKRLRLGDIDSNGTAVGSAIAAAATRLTQRAAKSKIIVLVTDGASNSGKLDPLQAAAFAATLGIRIYTVAIGTEGGRLSPRQTSMPGQEFDPETLREIARLTGGESYYAKTTAALRDTFATIDSLEKSESKRHRVVESRELFPWCLGAAFLFAFLALSAFSLNPPPVP
jgi:Ca-activated chloride channel family protein